MNIIDRFLYKLVLLTFILLLGVVLDKISVINLESVKNDLNKNLNVIDVVKAVNGDFNIIDLGDNSISVNVNDYKIEEENGVYKYYLKTDKVVNFSLGYVAKIFKENSSYKVFILDENDNLYCYYNLAKVNVKLYQIVKVNEVIGEASIINDDNPEYHYYYYLKIDEN